MRNRFFIRLSAIALALLMLAGLGASAFADDAAPRFARDRAQEKVWAVRVGTGTEEDCAALCEAMREAGFDAFLYESNGRLYALCGKFRDNAQAHAYKEQILAAVADAKAAVVVAWLPAEAVDAFEAELSGSPQEDEECTVYTVSLSMSRDPDYAAGIVERMEKAGFDVFIIETGSGYQVMSGKFADMCSALTYRDCIWSNTDRTDTYITQVTLKQSEVDAFTRRYEAEGLPGPIRSNLEKPTGAFYRETGGDTLAYTVQYSAGTSFSGAERNRDAMSAAGYPAFVYECARIYECMTGAFYSREDADSWCQTIKDNTAESDAYVTRAWLPSGIVK